MPPINRIAPIPNQNVERSQASDQGKSHGENPSEKKKGKGAKGNFAPERSEENLVSESSTLQLMSQAVDSAKVVELLSQAVKSIVPKGYRAPRAIHGPKPVSILSKKDTLNKAV